MSSDYQPFGPETYALDALRAIEEHLRSIATSLQVIAADVDGRNGREREICNELEHIGMVLGEMQATGMPVGLKEPDSREYRNALRDVADGIASLAAKR
jgi:hypothetical protein